MSAVVTNSSFEIRNGWPNFCGWGIGDNGASVPLEDGFSSTAASHSKDHVLQEFIGFRLLYDQSLRHHRPSAHGFDPDMMSHRFQLTPTMHRQPNLSLPASKPESYQQRKIVMITGGRVGIRAVNTYAHPAHSVMLLRNDNKGDSTSLGQPAQSSGSPTGTVIIVGSRGAGKIL